MTRLAVVSTAMNIDQSAGKTDTECSVGFRK
jgi:hypothetical protein